MTATSFRNSFLAHSRGLTLNDTPTITWAFNPITNILTADATVAAGSVADHVIANVNLVQVSQATIKGRHAAGGTGDVEDLSASQVKTILALASTDISDFTEAAQDAALGVMANTGRIAFTYNDPSNSLSADIVTASLDNSYLANMAQSTIKGRAAGAGTGAPTDLSVAQVKTLLTLDSVENTPLSTWTGSTNLTTLGTIATGSWNATAIADGKIASALTGKTYNGLTLTSLATGFTIAGGTTSKTLTVALDANVSGTNTGDQSAANPSALVGLTAVNGTALTFKRSDASSAIDQSITPTWTGTHVFNRSGNNPGLRIGPASGVLEFQNNGSDNRYIVTDGDDTATNTLTIQAGGGSDDFGGAVRMYAKAHATYPGDVWVGASLNAGNIRFGKGGIGPGTEFAQISHTGMFRALSTVLSASETRVETGLAVRAASDSTIPSSASLAADAELQLTVNETGKYVIEGFLAFYEAILGTGGFQFDLNAGSANISAILWGADGYVTAVVGNPAASSASTAQSYGTVATSSSAPSFVNVFGLVSFSATGTFGIRWAQASSSLNGTTRAALSYLRLHKVSA